jgi:hypothetical protein
MKERCSNPNSAQFKWYGGKGITVCARWRESYAHFLEDMGTRPEKHTIDRIDNTKGYAPDNCRWSTPKTQVHNSSKIIWVEYQGKKIMLRELCRDMDIPFLRVYARYVKRGLPLEASLHEPDLRGESIWKRKVIRKNTRPEAKKCPRCHSFMKESGAACQRCTIIMTWEVA